MPFPLHALGREGAAAAEALRRTILAPDAICGQSILTAMSVAASLFGKVRSFHGGALPIAAYFITVARSGERKTTADEAAMKGVRGFEKEMRRRYAEAEAARRAAEEDRSGKRGKAKRDDDRGPSAEILATDPTFEGLLDAMSRGPGTACLANDDAAGFFGGFAMSRDQRQKTISGLSQIFSGSEVKRPRAHGSNELVGGVPLTLHLMFQPYLLPQVYGDQQMCEQGILPRVLPAYPESSIGSRFFRKPAQPDLDALASFNRRCLDILREFHAAKELHAAPMDVLAEEQRVLPLSSEAERLLIDLADKVEAASAPGKSYAGISSFAARAAENATRLAAIITLFDNPAATEVEASAVENARELMRYYLTTQRHLCRVSLADRKEADAAELGTWLFGQFGADVATHDQRVSQYAPAKFRDMAARRAALNILARHRWIEMLPANSIIDGSPRKIAFRISPDIESVL